jgi:mono/diheme cytochrome c family protein
MMWRISILLAAATGAHAAVVAADSNRGARLFESLACIQCHGVNGRGARIGPDLGRLVDRNFTPASLAATMWNHAPAMWAAMRERSIPVGQLDEQAAADLFAYFYSARFFEKPGDAARGKRLFADRGCARCHGLTESLQPGIQAVSQWRSLNSPIALAEEMWNHLPNMRAAAGLREMTLPQLTSQELTDLLVYLRNLPSMREKPGEFRTAAGEKGEALFQSKDCARCHQTGAAFAGRIKGSTLTEIAAAMWNHAPRMAAAGAKPATFEPGEMRELLSYLWAKQFFENSGDAAGGKRVFSAKRCASCHEDAASGAPQLAGRGRQFSGAFMVSALWHHGPAMLEQMKSKNITWPRFDGREMADLIGYLNSRTSGR